MTEKITSEGKEAETHENIEGTPSPVVEFEVPDTEVWVVPEGQALVAEFLTDDGDHISRSSHYALGAREPGDPMDIPSMYSEQIVAPFAALSIRDQQSGENADRRRLKYDDHPETEGGNVVLEPNDTLELWLESDDVVDPDDGVYVEIEIERKSV